MAVGMYFVITDGTTTCTFADGNDPPGANSYAISSDAWAPAVAGLLTSQLGGRGPYADVVETIPINIMGSTVPTLLANAQALERLIQQAERWARGENVAPVVVKYSPRGATVSNQYAALQAAILGRDPSASGTNAPSAVTLPPSFDRELGGLIIADGTLTFLRRGAWLLNTAHTTGASASIANPGPYPITGMTSTPNLSPCIVTLAGLTASSSLDTTDSKPIILLAHQASDIQFLEAEDAAVGPYTSVAEANNNARGGSVLRYTPVAATENLSGEFGLLALQNMTAGARRFALFAAVRNNSATTTWTIRVATLFTVRASGPAVRLIGPYTRPITIDASHTRPRFVPLGIISMPYYNALASVQLAITASAASGSLDIDYLAVLAVDNPYARVIQLDQASAYGDARASDIYIDGGAESILLAPSIYQAFEGGPTGIDVYGYYGDAYPVASGTTFAAALLGKRADAPNNQCWCYSVQGGAVASLVANCWRANAYLTPE